jgi:hypothetical protein
MSAENGAEVNGGGEKRKLEEEGEVARYACRIRIHYPKTL